MTNLFFDPLPDEIQRTSQRRELQVGNVLFNERSATDSLFFVESGCVRLIVQPVDGKELVLYRALDGELIAEDHLVRETYAYTAIADKKTVVVSINRKKLLEFIVRDRETLIKYMTMQSERSRQLQQNFERLALPKATDKVLHLLNSLTTGNEAIDLSGRLKTLASDLNVTHETMYRTLRALEEQGAISRDSGWVRVIR